MLKLQRIYHNDKQTIGKLKLENGSSKFECLTIELPPKQNKPNISRIPEGKYDVTKLQGNQLKWSRFDYPHLWIKNVPKRKGIKIHIGNYYSQIAGCILVGEKFTDLNNDGYVDVTNSTQTLNQLVKVCPNQTKIEINNEKNIEKMKPAKVVDIDVDGIDKLVQNAKLI